MEASEVIRSEVSGYVDPALEVPRVPCSVAVAITSIHTNATRCMSKHASASAALAANADATGGAITSYSVPGYSEAPHPVSASLSVHPDARKRSHTDTLYTETASILQYH